MNSVTLIGRLTKDPELSYTQNQMAICRFTLAVDRIGKDRGADFIRITVFDKQAVNCDRYLAKGRQAAVSGRIQTGSYKDRNGQTVYTTDVIAQAVEFLSAPQGEYSASEGFSQQNGSSYRQGQNFGTEGKYGDLPQGFSSVSDAPPWEGR